MGRRHPRLLVGAGDKWFTGVCALRIELKGKSGEVESLREGLQSKHQQSIEDAQEIENLRSEVQRKEKMIDVMFLSL